MTITRREFLQWASATAGASALGGCASGGGSAGKVVVMVSSDLPEVLGMADRIVVMHDGRITGTIADAKQATQESIMELAVG